MPRCTLSHIALRVFGKQAVLRPETDAIIGERFDSLS